MQIFVRHGVVWRRAAVLVTLCAALAAIASSGEIYEALLELFGAMEALIDRHPATGAVLFVGLAAISAMFTFVSIAVLVPAVVFAWGVPVSLLLLWTGWTLGGIGSYLIGRFLGRPVVRWLTADETLHRLESRVRRDAPLWLVLLLQLALPSEIPGYLLGLARYPLARYAIALGLAELPYSIATVRLGESFLQHRFGLVLTIGFSIALLSVAAFYFLRSTLGRVGESTVTSRERLR